MSDARNWVEEAEALKQRLAEIEKAASGFHIAGIALDELKSAVDHCRTALWASVLANQENTAYDGATVIVNTRMRRVIEMCERIRNDVRQGRIWRDTPGIAACHSALSETESALSRLFQR